MEKFQIEKDIAQYIKKEFDSRKGATWHCIVGRNFGSFVTHGTSISYCDGFDERQNMTGLGDARSVNADMYGVEQKRSTSSIST
jgi:hypothetical protein